jgi:fucokinase
VKGKDNMSHKTLFLQQSYEDCTRQYMELLEKQKMPLWDYVILTASNESQAQSYRMQIQYRLDHGMLPKSIHYAVLPDPDGKRVGSGGATLNVLRYIYQDAGSFDDKRILVIHSGGDSKRVPQYSACGKLFSPVPRLLPNGRRSTLFDEFMISMCGVAARIRAGMLVCSGDVLLLFNPLQIDFYGSGAAALSIKEPAEIGKNHGVYRVDEQGNVGGFLHKKTVDQLHELQAADENGNVDIDTGAVIMDTDLLKALYKLVDTPEQFDAYVNENTRLSFYADFLYPLASQSSLEQYYKETPEGDFTPELHECRTKLWEVLHTFHMKLIRMSPAAFIHFGTTKELRHLMTEGMEQFVYLGWNSFVNTNSTSIRGGYASGNSYISKRAKIGKGTYVEDSYVHHGTVIGTNCVVSGVTLDGQNIPDGAVIHGLKLGEEQFVARMYGVNDNPKECSLFGRKLSEPLWTAKIYPICRTMREAVDAALQAYEQGFPVKDSFVSLKDSFNMADVTAILPWQDKLDDKVRVESLLEAIDNKVDLKQAFISCGGNVSPRVERLLLREAERSTRGETFAFERSRTFG